MRFIDSISDYPVNNDLTEKEKGDRLNIMRRFIAKCNVAGIKIYLLDFDWYKK